MSLAPFAHHVRRVSKNTRACLTFKHYFNVLVFGTVSSLANSRSARPDKYLERIVTTLFVVDWWPLHQCQGLHSNLSSNSFHDVQCIDHSYTRGTRMHLFERKLGEEGLQVGSRPSKSGFACGLHQTEKQGSHVLSRETKVRPI